MSDYAAERVIPKTKKVNVDLGERINIVIDKVAPPALRHPLSQRFHDVLKEMGELHDKKQSDYGRRNNPFANVTGSIEWGIRPWVGAMLRANDKIKRLQKYAQSGTLANEGARDSFLDLAVYAIIGLVLWETQDLTPEDINTIEELYEALAKKVRE